MKPYSIADILYSGHPSTLNSTTDNFFRNRWKDVQTFIAKPLCSGHQSIANITFMFQIILLPRTPNNRPCKKYIYILLYTLFYSFLKVFFDFCYFIFSQFNDLFWSIKVKDKTKFELLFTMVSVLKLTVLKTILERLHGEYLKELKIIRVKMYTRIFLNMQLKVGIKY